LQRGREVVMLICRTAFWLRAVAPALTVATSVLPLSPCFSPACSLVRQASRMSETVAEPPPDAWDEADEETLVARVQGAQLQEDPDKEVEIRWRDAVLLRETDGVGFSSRGGRPRRRRPRPRRQFFSAAEAAAWAAEDALSKADGW
jgi:hypothetical protein